jgi:peptidoglycan/LPS O-acetylase OafA/YrhL
VSKENLSNFNALCVFAVLVVIYGNGYILTNSVAPGLWGEPFFRIGLHLLFAAAGYLLVGIWQDDPDWRRYILRLFIRVLPGLAVAVLATVLVIGLIATRHSPQEYLLHRQTLRYLTNIVLIQQRNLPGVFEGLQWGGAANPMLWTLVAGGMLAPCVPLAAALSAKLRIATLLAAALVLGCLNQFVLPDAPVGQFRVLRIDGRALMAEAPFFIMGMLWRQPGPIADRLFRADLAMIAFLGNWFVATWWEVASVPLLWLTLPYMVACFCRQSPPLLHGLPNIAYGMYLLAFPLQQLIVAHWPQLDHPIVACAAAAALFGTLSWFGAERPAMRRFSPRLLHSRPRAA